MYWSIGSKKTRAKVNMEMSANKEKSGRLNLNSSFYSGTGYVLYHAFGNNSATPLDTHFHEEYAISVQLDGLEHCQVGRKEFRFERGDLVLLNPHQPHNGNTGGETSSEYLTLYVSKDLVSDFAAKHQAPTAQPEFTHVHVRQQFQIQELLRHLHHQIQVDSEQGFESEETQESVRDVLRAVLDPYSNIREPRQHGSSRVSHRKIARALVYMNNLDSDQLSANITLDTLAEIADMSRFHFVRQFSELVGMTPCRYLRTLRLCKAGQKLRHTR